MADTINQGGSLWICTTAQNSDLNTAAFEALTYVEITRIVTMPSIGITTNMVQQDYIDTEISQFQKGVKAGSASELVVGKDTTDAGQDALIAASLTKNNYAFKRVYTDSPNTVTTTNSTTYFRALVGEAVDQGGAVEDFENYTFPIQINGQRPIVVKPEAI